MLDSAARWLTTHAAVLPDDFHLGINVSALQFQRGDLLGAIDRVLRDSGCAAQRLELEITESTLLAGGDELQGKLAALRERGLRLALDDFGTGYSSLHYLIGTRFDTVKIDRSFVQAMLDNRRGAQLVRTIIAMAHELDMRVVAEGVETAAQRDTLLDWGCDCLQGFLLARPVPEAEFLKLLKAAMQAKDRT